MWTWMLGITVSFAGLSPTTLDALRAGDCAGALPELVSGRSPAHALARARCGGEAPTDSEIRGAGPLEPYLRWLSAESALEEGDPEEADALIEGISLPGEAGLQLRILRARALIEQGRSLEARPDLRKLLSTSEDAAARFWLAYGAEQRGDKEPALKTYRAAWARNPTSPYAERAAAQVRSMGESLPDWDSAAGRALILGRARALRERYHSAEALQLYLRLEAREHAQGDSWERELAMAAFEGRDYPDAVRRMEVLSPWEGDPELAFHHALALSRTGDYAAAARSYERLLRHHPNSRWGDTASYKLGYLAYDGGELSRAVRLFDQHIERFPRSRHLSEARWFKGWSLYQLRRWEEALIALSPLAESSSSLSAGAQFWSARSYRALGREAEAEDILRRLAQGSGEHAYRWLALREQGGSPSAQQDTAPLSELQWAGLSELSPAWERAWALLLAGQSGWARDEALALQEEVPPGRQAQLGLAHFLLESGAYRQAQKVAGPWCRQGGSAQQLCVPRPEQRLVSARAQQSALPALLPYAIMVAESGLDPAVTSPAGARGLMQLMPEVGGELHALLYPERVYSPDLLYQPGYNASLGTSELGRLWTRFSAADRSPEATLAMVIAGYNAGPEAVERWLAASPAGPLDPAVFMENIGYTETRRYLRRVLGYLMRYEDLYGAR